MLQRMEPVTGTWLREKRMKKNERQTLAWKCQEKLNWHFANIDTKKKNENYKTTSSV